MMEVQLPLLKGDSTDPLFLQFVGDPKIQGIGLPKHNLQVIYREAHRHLMHAFELCGAFWHEFSDSDTVDITHLSPS